MEARCGWCKLALEHPQLVDTAHRRHVELGLGARVIVSSMAKTAREADIALPSARALSRHFLLHAGDAAPVVVVADDDDDGADNGTWELRELRGLYRRVKRRIDAIDTAHAGEGRGDAYALGQLVGAANSARQILETIHRTRGPEATVNGVLQVALRHFALGLARAFRDEVTSGFPGSDGVDWLLANRFGALARVAANDAHRAGIASLHGDGEPAHAGGARRRP